MLFLLQESDFFQLFDVDGDGLVSFYEYLMLVTFLSIPPEVWVGCWHSAGQGFSTQQPQAQLCDSWPGPSTLQCGPFKQEMRGSGTPIPCILHAGGEDGLWHV